MKSKKSSGSISVTCRVCAQEMQTFPSRASRKKFCSRECYAKHLSTAQKGETHPMFGKKHSPEAIAKMRAVKSATAKKGEASPSWKGGKYLSRGYVMVSASRLSAKEREFLSSMIKHSSGGTGAILEHRLKMARHLGRPLLRSEVVHHRNGIKTDNRIRNLELSDDATHKWEHQRLVKELRRLRAENERLRLKLRRQKSR